MSTGSSDDIRIGQVMLLLHRFPVVRSRVIVKEALEAMGEFGLGIICIVNDEQTLLGVLTDGDIRRTLLRVQKPLSAFFVDDALAHAVLSPCTIKPDDTLRSAVDLMEQKRIWDLPVTDDDDRLVGLLHLHPAIQALLRATAS